MSNNKSSPIDSPDRASASEMETSASVVPSSDNSKSSKETAKSSSHKTRLAQINQHQHQLGAVASLEEMEPKVLLFQNRKLAERLQHYHATTEELRSRSEQLQQRLSATDSEIFIINRHMKNLDENVGLLLKRFQTENLGETESENPRSPLESFMVQISTLDEDELDKTLSGRVQDMRNIIGKLVQVYDTVCSQSRSVMEKLRTGENVDEERQAMIEKLLKKNEQLEREQLAMHQKHVTFSLENSRMKDRVAKLETELTDERKKVENLSWSLDQEQIRREKAENMVLEARKNLTALEAQIGTKKRDGAPVAEGVVAPANNISQSKMGEMVSELEDQKTLSANRLQEISRLQEEKVALMVQIDDLKVKVESPSDDLVVHSAKYKSLQTHFSVLFVEHEKLKEYYKVARDAVGTMRANYLQQVKEAQRAEEEAGQLFQNFLSSLQTATNHARADYQKMKIDVDLEKATRETSGTSKDYDKLFKSVMQQNNSLQTEALRLRKRVQALQTELARSQPKDASAMMQKSPVPMKRSSNGDIKPGESTNEPSTSSRQSNMDGSAAVDDSQSVKDLRKQLRDKNKEYEELKLLYDITKQASKNNRELIDIMASERKLKDENAELKKNLHAMEERAVAAESVSKNFQVTMETSKNRIKQLEERIQEFEKEKERSDKARTGPDDEMLRKIKFLEETVANYRAKLERERIEAEVMMNDMEITGQALEDLQNQNKALIDQLKERDSTNFRCMSDNIRNDQIIKTLRSEKATQESRYRAAGELILKYEKQLLLAEERIKAIEEANESLESDRKNCDYMVESWKRKAIEQTKETNELRLKLEQLDREVTFARTVHADKLKSYESDVYKTRRLIEENADLKRKLERAKLMEATGSSEEILKEDLREYKELVSCPSCKAARKDTVLTKCFHVFCNTCITKRYETRQRRCPQCSTAFGASDYHRLFLT